MPMLFLAVYCLEVQFLVFPAGALKINTGCPKKVTQYMS